MKKQLGARPGLVFPYSVLEAMNPSTESSRALATLENNKNTVAIFPPRAPSAAVGKRGPKPKILPLELIMQWAGEGDGSKKIASRLKTEHGIEIGFRTIARILCGQRIL